jgi:hypothetical protein
LVFRRRPVGGQLGLGDEDQRPEILGAVARAVVLAADAQNAVELLQQLAGPELDRITRVDDNLHHQDAGLVVLDDEPSFGRPETHERHALNPLFRRQDGSRRLRRF